MVYLSDTSKKNMLYLALILLTAGIGAMALVSETGIDGYFENTVLITRIYWPVIIILFFVVVLVNRNAKEKTK
jgi:heme/copper-type cytochrome/quinol oxidase subunit 2